MKKYNLSFPALLDPEGTIKTLYQTTGVPESFIVNQQGILMEKLSIQETGLRPKLSATSVI